MKESGGGIERKENRGIGKKEGGRFKKGAHTLKERGRGVGWKVAAELKGKSAAQLEGESAAVLEGKSAAELEGKEAADFKKRGRIF